MAVIGRHSNVLSKKEGCQRGLNTYNKTTAHCLYANRANLEKVNSTLSHRKYSGCSILTMSNGLTGGLNFRYKEVLQCDITTTPF